MMKRSIVLVCLMLLLASCGTLKVICIDVETGTEKTVALRHSKDSPAASDTCWDLEHLIKVDEESGEFYTITCNDKESKCYINAYSPTGVFNRQYECPFWVTWYLPMETIMLGDEIVTFGGPIDGKLGGLIGLVNSHLIAYNIKTQERKVLRSSNISNGNELYMLDRYNQDIAFIFALHLKQLPFKNDDFNPEEAEIHLFSLDIRSHEITEIKYPADVWPFPCPDGVQGGDEPLFWFRTVDKNPDHLGKNHYMEAKPDGSISEIMDLPEHVMNGETEFIEEILLHHKNPIEYVYLTHVRRRKNDDPTLSQDWTFLCRFWAASGHEVRTKLDARRGDEGIYTTGMYASDDRIALKVYKDPSSYVELFLTPRSKTEFQIFDRDFNLLKRFSLPHSMHEGYQAGKYFYHAYW